MNSKEKQINNIPEFQSCEHRELPAPEEAVPNGVWHTAIREELRFAEDYYERQFDVVVDELILVRNNREHMSRLADQAIDANYKAFLMIQKTGKVNKVLWATILVGIMVIISLALGISV